MVRVDCRAILEEKHLERQEKLENGLEVNVQQNKLLYMARAKIERFGFENVHIFDWLCQSLHLNLIKVYICHKFRSVSMQTWWRAEGLRVYLHPTVVPANSGLTGG